MTSRQSTAFAFVARLMLSIPGATIHTLRELIEDRPCRSRTVRSASTSRNWSRPRRPILKISSSPRRYGDLKQQIARRLYGVLSVPAFDRMFSAADCKLDMFEAMQTGKVVLGQHQQSALEVRRLRSVRPVHHRVA